MAQTLIAAARWLAAALALAPALCAQQPRKPAWPTLPRAQAERATQLFANLMANNAELRAAAEEELAAMGAGAAPLLMARLSDHATNINPALLRVLERVTEPVHAPLLAREAASRKVALRRFALQRLAVFHSADLAPVFRAAVRDGDPHVVFAAQLGLAGLGDFEFMEAIFERCMKDWSAAAPLVAPALAGARGEPGTRWVLERIATGGVRAQIAGLRLLRALGVRQAAARIAAFLDSEEHNVKKEAINALRAIVDGAPPLEELSVFDAIELAREWKKRT
jgi:hypothetical protein